MPSASATSCTWPKRARRDRAGVTTDAARVLPARMLAARRSHSLLVSGTWLNWWRIMSWSVVSSSASRMSDST